MLDPWQSAASSQARFPCLVRPELSVLEFTFTSAEGDGLLQQLSIDHLITLPRTKACIYCFELSKLSSCL